MLLKKGMYNNSEVKNMQHMLSALGYNLVVDGDFGEGTKVVVFEFQAKEGLVVDGLVGDNTYTVIECKYKLSFNGSVSTQPWMQQAKSQIGMHERTDESVVQDYWRKAKLSGLAKRSASSVPWCSGFCCAMFEDVGIRSARTDGAKNWLNWGKGLESPVDGCIVVFTRSGGGHVGFVTGEDNQGNLLVLGGNQGDAVNIKSFSKTRVTGYRYPLDLETPTTLTIGGIPTELSENES